MTKYELRYTIQGSKPHSTPYGSVLHSALEKVKHIHPKNQKFPRAFDGHRNGSDLKCLCNTININGSLEIAGAPNLRVNF